jgi:short-subunit dehydrogenase
MQTKKILLNLLREKIVLITGATSGIGKCIAKDFSQFNLKSLILISRSKSNLDQTLHELGHADFDIFPIKCDVANKEDVEKMTKMVIDRYEYLDILINNAGVGIFKKVEETSIEEIERVNFTNYFGMIYCIKGFLGSMIKRNSGNIINVASLAASFGIPGMAAYCGSKFAMLGFSESLYYELQKTKVKLTVISPIGVKTNFFNNEYFNYKVPMNYVLDPQKVSQAVFSSFVSNKFQIFVPGIAGSAPIIKYCFPKFIKFYIEKQFNKKFSF